MLALLNHPEIEAWPVVRDDQGRHLGIVHANPQPIAGDAGLRHFKKRAADSVPVTDTDLERARSDRAFRQKMLEQNLDALLLGMKKLRAGTASPKAGAGAKQLREGVELAVRLAEMIQNAGGRAPRSF